jgi:cytochrome c556
MGKPQPRTKKGHSLAQKKHWQQASKFNDIPQQKWTAGVEKVDPNSRPAQRSTTWKAYLESLEADVQHRHAEIHALNIELGQQKSRVESLQTDLKEANQSFMVHLERQNVNACTHDRGMQRQLDIMQNALAATTEQLDIEITKN